MVERKLPKLHTRVRFPSPAPISQQTIDLSPLARSRVRGMATSCVSAHCRELTSRSVARKKRATRRRPESREETPKEGIRRRNAAPSTYAATQQLQRESGAIVTKSRKRDLFASPRGRLSPREESQAGEEAPAPDERFLHSGGRAERLFSSCPASCRGPKATAKQSSARGADDSNVIGVFVTAPRGWPGQARP